MTDKKLRAWNLPPDAGKIRVDKQTTSVGVTSYYAMLVTDRYLGTCDEHGYPREKNKPGRKKMPKVPRKHGDASYDGINAGKLVRAYVAKKQKKQRTKVAHETNMGRASRHGINANKLSDKKFIPGKSIK